MNNRISEENLRICPICNAMYDATKIANQHCIKCKNSLTSDYMYLCKIVDYETYLTMMKNKEIQSYKALYKEISRTTQYTNLPKCPTCGSTNIRHISATERGVNAVMFGFFGNKRKCQFECLNPNCRYRW